MTDILRNPQPLKRKSNSLESGEEVVLKKRRLSPQLVNKENEPESDDMSVTSISFSESTTAIAEATKVEDGYKGFVVGEAFDIESDDDVSYDDDSFDEMEVLDIVDGTEAEEATTLMSELNIASANDALMNIGNSKAGMLSWIDQYVSKLSPEDLKAYEKTTRDLDKIDSMLSRGVIKLYKNITCEQGYVQTDYALLQFIRSFVDKFVNIVLNIATDFADNRESCYVEEEDVTIALKFLGKPFYCAPNTKNSVFDCELFMELAKVVCDTYSVRDEIYAVLQVSFEDYLETVLNCAVSMTDTNELTVGHLESVFSVWKKCPGASRLVLEM